MALARPADEAAATGHTPAWKGGASTEARARRHHPILGFDLLQYADWIPRRSYALEEAKASFDAVVGENAVVTGPLAPALVLGSSRVALPLYGMARPGIFDEYGVTHVVLGEPASTKEIETASPGILDRLDLVRTWPIRTRHLRRITVYRIRDAKPITEGRYTPTSFEQAADRIVAGDGDGAIAMLQEFRATHFQPIPDAIVLEAECRLAKGEEESAVGLLEEAVRLRPHAPPELYNLGVLYARRGENDRAIVLWRRGFAADPIDPDLARALRETVP